MPFNKKPYVLSIAGMDPSAGAGFLADVKTFEALGCYGLAVNTANTVQNDEEFKSCNWTSEEIIFQQLEILLKRFPVEVVKIGIVENFSVLKKLVDFLNFQNEKIKIIWDPVIKSSSGFTFQETQELQENLDAVLEKVFVVTPNLDEFQQLFSDLKNDKILELIKGKTNLYLKGGHRTEAVGLDELFTSEGAYFPFEAGRTDCSEKHGSGCVLSSAIAAHLALGFPLLEAAEKAKAYTEKVLASNKTLLGYHNV